GIVEYDDPSVTQQRADTGQCFVVDDHIELRRWNVGSQRPAHLHSTNRPARRRTATVVVQQLPQRNTERALDEAAALDVARELQRQGATRPAHAEVLIELRTLLQDDRYCGQRHDV